MTATTYTTELAEKFCAAIADGKATRTVCKMAGMPSKATVYRWLRENPEFAAMYEQATDERTDAQIEEIVDIADKVALDKDAIKKAKLRIYARLEAAQKMKPKKYGPKVQTEITGGLTVNSVKDLTDDQLAAIAAGGGGGAAGQA